MSLGQVAGRGRGICPSGSCAPVITESAGTASDMPVSIVIASWIRFDQPLWLTALILVAAPVILARHARRRGLPSNSVSVALRMTALAAMVLCLAQPAARWGARAKQSVLILRDVSASTRGQSHRDLTWPEDFSAERLDFAAAVTSGAARKIPCSTTARTLLVHWT